jgi:antirestriction protein ArdC
MRKPLSAEQKKQFIADKQATAIQRLDQAIVALQNSDQYLAYLKTAARFHRYSLHNQMLIWWQRPDATQVAGFKAWEKLGRTVRKGEKGIAIWVPFSRAASAARVAAGGSSEGKGREEENEQGETVQVAGSRFFGIGYVFDVAQTEGDALPAPPAPERLEGAAGANLYADLLRLAVREKIAVSVVEQFPDARNGDYTFATRSIRLLASLSTLHRAKTLAHELGHAFEHQLFGANTNRDEAETVAESVACVVLAHAGYDSLQYTVPYVTGWAGDVKVFRNQLDRIRQIANVIIDGIENAVQSEEAA